MKKLDLSKPRVRILSLGIELNDVQHEHLRSMRWLFGDGHRREGRTYLLAVVAVEKAMEHTDRRVRLFDHFSPGDPDTTFNLSREVRKVVDQLAATRIELARKARKPFASVPVFVIERDSVRFTGWHEERT